MGNAGFPTEVIESIKDSVDCNLSFFGNKVELGTMYIIMIAKILVLIGLFVAFNVVLGKKSK